MSDREPIPAQKFHGEHFTKTPWTVVLCAAGAVDSAEGAAALEWLCGRYWYPLYAFARRSGLAPHDAEDATQGFFCHLLESATLARADPARGRFRNFLLTAFKHHMGQGREQLMAWKRGGRHAHVSLDGLEAEERYQHEPVDSEDPARLFEAAWAGATIQAALGQLREEYARLGKSQNFEALQPFLTGDSDGYVAVCERIGLTPGAARIAVHRMRARFSELVRSEVAATVGEDDDVEEELRHLKSVLTGA